MNGHPVTQLGYFDVPLAEQVDLVAEAGAGWYRVDLGARDFAASTARFDELLTDAERRNIRLLPVLSLSPGGRGDAATPQQIHAAAVAFGRAVAGRYRGRITHWELGNELDIQALIRKGDRGRNGALWRWGDPDGSRPEDYEEGRYERARAEILGLGEGVRAADRGAATVVDTSGWLHYGFIERLVNEDHVPFDVLAWHWYSEMGDITRVQGKLDLVAYLKRYGKPLWLTEVSRRGGSAGASGRDFAEFVTHTVAQLGANPGIGGLFIYELLDEPYFGEAGESQYGLVEIARDGRGKWAVTQRKQAFDAYRSVIAAGGAGAGAAR
ncbi:MAG TPA: glycosyl hydrolase [Opitutaceae bacterium]|nr:glycosyl hydrolase [Opitutaceae bacterium]